MASIGIGNSPNSSFFWVDNGSGIQYWSNTNGMPTGGGVVTDIYVYAGGDGVSWTGYLCIWGATALLWASAGITFPNNGRTTLGQQWIHSTVSNLFVPAGTVNLGFWAGGNMVSTQNTVGGTFHSNSAVGSPSALGANTQYGNAMSAYIIYTPGAARVRRSGAWKYGPSYVRRSGAWALGTNTAARRSGVWTPGQ